MGRLIGKLTVHAILVAIAAAAAATPPTVRSLETARARLVSVRIVVGRSASAPAFPAAQIFMSAGERPVAGIIIR